MNRRMPNGMYGGVRGERKSPLLDFFRDFNITIKQFEVMSKIEDYR